MTVVVFAIGGVEWDDSVIDISRPRGCQLRTDGVIPGPRHTGLAE